MKQCNAENCNFGCFGGGYCKSHQWMRVDKPKQSSFKPVKPLKRKSGICVSKTKNNRSNSPKPTQKQELMVSFGFTNQKELFEFVWNSRSHTCPVSGMNLDLVPENKKHWCCAHILNKKNYPFWKYNPDNILLIHPDVHYCVDNFYEDMRKKYDYNFDIWFDLVNFMKQKYLDFLKENEI